MQPIIHIYGASGAGTTTLGRALAEAAGWKHLDSDNYYWLRTAVPYTQKRPKEERAPLMLRDMAGAAGAVISGSLCGWGDALLPRFTLGVRLYTDTALRLQRLKAREAACFGDRILPGGDMAANHQAFLRWAAGYDCGGPDTRSSALHDRWERGMSCLILRLDGGDRLEANVSAVLARLASLGQWAPAEGESYTLTDSLRAWEANADFWDAQMGDASNRFHREVVKPRVTELLAIAPGDRVLEVACGNGNFAVGMAEAGARVVAADYSPRMIQLARRRHPKAGVDFRVIDATDEDQLMSLAAQGPYDKAVCNMAVMDMTDVSPLFRGVARMLRPGGCFVFATQHPCFVTLTDRYLTPHAYMGEAIAGQPRAQCYYHRSLQDILNLCFRSDLTVDGCYEEAYGRKEKPDVIILRARKA